MSESGKSSSSQSSSPSSSSSGSEIDTDIELSPSKQPIKPPGPGPELDQEPASGPPPPPVFSSLNPEHEEEIGEEFGGFPGRLSGLDGDPLSGQFSGGGAARKGPSGPAEGDGSTDQFDRGSASSPPGGVAETDHWGSNTPAGAGLSSEAPRIPEWDYRRSHGGFLVSDEARASPLLSTEENKAPYPATGMSYQPGDQFDVFTVASNNQDADPRSITAPGGYGSRSTASGPADNFAVDISAALERSESTESPSSTDDSDSHEETVVADTDALDISPPVTPIASAQFDDTEGSLFSGDLLAADLPPRAADSIVGDIFTPIHTARQSDKKTSPTSPEKKTNEEGTNKSNALSQGSNNATVLGSRSGVDAPSGTAFPSSPSSPTHSSEAEHEISVAGETSKYTPSPLALTPSIGAIHGPMTSGARVSTDAVPPRFAPSEASRTPRPSVSSIREGDRPRQAAEGDGATEEDPSARGASSPDSPDAAGPGRVEPATAGAVAAADSSTDRSPPAVR